MKHRPTTATILTHNMCHNLEQVKKLSNHLPTWAVIKANAYGHTITAALEGFAKSEGIALLEIENAQLARSLGWEKKILMLEGAFFQSDYADYDELQCDFVIHQKEQMIWLSDYMKSLSSHKADMLVRRCEVWLKLNSGMNRLGFMPTEYLAAFDLLKNLGFRVHHLTHFANADVAGDADLSHTSCPKPRVQDQWKLFKETIQDLEGLISAANSAALLHHPYTHGDFTRPGIMLYGAAASGRFAEIASYGLKPTMRLQSKVIAIQNLQAGEHVGYGGRFIADQLSQIAVIACGYADGYPRHAPNGTPVWICANERMPAGRMAPIAGRVSMDMITIDITGLPVQVGDDVELWGEHLPIDDVASAAHTVGYELMCALSPRVKISITKE